MYMFLESFILTACMHSPPPLFIRNSIVSPLVYLVVFKLVVYLQAKGRRCSCKAMPSHQKPVSVNIRAIIITLSNKVQCIFDSHIVYVLLLRCNRSVQTTIIGLLRAYLVRRVLVSYFEQKLVVLVVSQPLRKQISKTRCIQETDVILTKPKALRLLPVH